MLRLIYSLYNIEPLLQAICFNHVTSGKENQFVESVLNFLLFFVCFLAFCFCMSLELVFGTFNQVKHSNSDLYRSFIRLRICICCIFINFAINYFKPFLEIGASDGGSSLSSKSETPSSPMSLNRRTTSLREPLGRVFETNLWMKMNQKVLDTISFLVTASTKLYSTVRWRI